MPIWVRASQRAGAGDLVPHSASRSALSALWARTRVPDVRSHTRMQGRDSLLSEGHAEADARGVAGRAPSAGASRLRASFAQEAWRAARPRLSALAMGRGSPHDRPIAVDCSNGGQWRCAGTGR
jgi:hypothetical protein